MTYIQALEYGLVALLVFILVRTGYWFWQGRKLQKSGYMPPPSTKVARVFYKFACRMITAIGVGPVKVIGAENAKFIGRGLVLPNHQFALDFAVVGKVIPFSYRQVAKAAEVKNPVIGAVAAWIGTVGVQVEGGKSQAAGGGQAVIDTGARILTRSDGARMLLFPQGKLVYDNVIREEDCRTGAMRMMNATVALVGVEGLYYLPMAIHYKRDPKDATRFHRFVNTIGIKSFRRWREKETVTNPDGTTTKRQRVFNTYGATVAIGKPVAMATQSADPRTATNELAAQIKTLLEIAQKG